MVLTFCCILLDICLMAFVRIEKKKSGDYIRIVRAVRKNGKATNETLYSLGKVQDYTP